MPVSTWHHHVAELKRLLDAVEDVGRGGVVSTWHHHVAELKLDHAQFLDELGFLVSTWHHHVAELKPRSRPADWKFLPVSFHVASPRGRIEALPQVTLADQGPKFPRGITTWPN